MDLSKGHPEIAPNDGPWQVCSSANCPVGRLQRAHRRCGPGVQEGPDLYVIGSGSPRVELEIQRIPDKWGKILRHAASAHANGYIRRRLRKNGDR